MRRRVVFAYHHDAVQVGIVAAVIVALSIAAVWSGQGARAAKQEAASFLPVHCAGWDNPDAARTIDLDPQAPWSAFSADNSAGFDTSTYVVNTVESPIFSCDGWRQSKGRAIANVIQDVTLRLSIAALGAESGEDVITLRTSTDGSTWTIRKTFVIRGEASNAAHGGYVTIPLDGVTSLAALQKLRLQIVPNLVAEAAPSKIWIDGFRVDVHGMTVGQQQNVRVEPASCSGWSNADAARNIDQHESDSLEKFKSAKSAGLQRSDSSAFNLDRPVDVAPLVCADFRVLRTTQDQRIASAAVTLSLAAVASETSDDVMTPEYSLDSGQTWTALTGLVIRGTVSNGTNGGYWRFNLPAGLSREQLAALTVRLRYTAGETPTTLDVRVDGLALDLVTERTTGALQNLFSSLSFLTRTSFLPIEEPTLYVDADQADVVAVTDVNGRRIDVPITATREGARIKLQLRPGREMRPGTYTVRLKSKAGRRVVEDVQTFTWGLLTVNTPKSAYRRGDQVPITIGVVDDVGRTVCNADLTLTVVRPDATEMTRSTRGGTISVSPDCGPKSITANPDYLTKFEVDQVGIYRVEVMAATDGGERSATSTITVGDQVPLSVERVGPTRINPTQPYLVHLFVNPAADVHGQFTESVPATFVISDVSNHGQVSDHPGVGTKSITWDVDWRSGVEYELTYAFDAPDVSPALFTLGPTVIGEYREERSWQIASDEVLVTDQPDMKVTQVPTDKRDWDGVRDGLVAITKPFYQGNETAVVKAWDRGFAVGQTPNQQWRVEKVEIVPPAGVSGGYDRAVAEFVKDGRQRSVIYVVPNTSFHPGRYTVRTTLAGNGRTVVEEQSFEWGTFGLDFRGAVLTSGIETPVSIGSVDDSGHPKCDDEFQLIVTNPEKKILTLSTSNGTIQKSGPCVDPNSPDGGGYVAAFNPGTSGSYNFHLVRNRDGQSRGLVAMFSVGSPSSASKDLDKELDAAVALSKQDFRADESPSVDVEVRRDAFFSALGVDATVRTVRSVAILGPDQKERLNQPTDRTEKRGRSTLKKVALDSSVFVRPGKYALIITIEQNGVVSTVERSFTWGVLAVNVRRATERPQTPTQIGLAVLDDSGTTLCDATVSLEVISPKKSRTALTTADGSIKRDPTCVDKGVTNNPDYGADYTTDGPGVYTMRLTAETRNGRRTIEDTFEVRDSVAFDVERTVFPTRIYPLADYPVSFTVVASQDYSGPVMERVPSSFGIYDISGAGAAADAGSGEQTISWNVEWRAGQPYTLGYTFDAPDVSPEFYRLGPLQIGGVAGFGEARQWQIASDSAGGIVYGTRAYSSGFELQSTTAQVEYTANINTPTISTTTYRSGAAALRTNPTSSTQGAEYRLATSDDTVNGHYARAYVYVASAPAAKTSIMVFRSATAGADEVSIRMNTDRTLELWNDETNAQVGSASSAVSLNTWTRIELAYAWLSTLAARVDGVEFAADRALATNIYEINTVRIGVLTTSTSADLYWDDFAINNDNIGFESWVGDGKLAYLRPNGNGTNTAWTGDYTNVNETTPDDATGYVNCTANSQTEDYDITDSATAGIGATDIIKSMSLNVRFSSSATGSHNFIGRLLLNGSNTGITRSYNSTAWFTNIASSTSSMLPLTTIYDLPGTSMVAYTPSDIDSTQVQLTTSSCATAQARISTIWVIAEYVPAEGGRAFSSGFELQDTTAGVEWTTKDGSPTISTTTYRGGAAALRISSLASGTRQALDDTFKAANANGPFFARAYLNIATAPSAENRILDFRDSSNNARAYITLDNSRQLRLYDEDGAIGSASSALSTATWYRVEIKFDASPSAGSHVVEGKIDGTAFATSSSRSISTGVTQLGLGGNLNSEAQTTGDWFFDDVAMNQNYGASQNGYPGAGKIVHLRPNAAGDVDSWVKNPATCNAASNYYECVDEVTPNDATDYLSDLFGVPGGGPPFEANITDTATAGIASTDPITLVQTGLRFANSSTTTQALSIQLRDGTGAGSNYINSQNIITNTTAWNTNAVSAPYTSPLTTYTRPEKSSGWTATVLDSTQIGVAYLNNAVDQYVSAVWLLVEYNPPAGIVVSGNIYTNASNETTGFNCASTNLTIHVSINGGANNNGTCTANPGTYSVTTSSSPAAGDPVVIFIDSGASQKATTVTLATDGTSPITANLIQDRVVVQYENAGPMTNAKMGTGDNADAGIRYSVSGGALTVESGIELHVLAGKTFTPGGSVTTTVASTAANPDGDVHIPSTATLSMGTNALSVGGDFNNAGTFSKSSGQTTTLTATGTGFTVTPGTGNYDNLTFNGTNGGWSFASTATLDGDLTMTAGTLSGTSSVSVNGGDATGDGTINLTGGTFLVDGTGNFGGATAWTFSGLTFGDGSGTTTTTASGSGGITATGVMTIAANQTLSAGSKTYTLSGSGTPLVSNGTFTTSTSTINYQGTTSTVTVANGLTYYNLGIGVNDANSVTYSFTTSTTSATNTLTVASGDTFSLGTRFDLGNSSTGAGSLVLNGTLTGSYLSYFPNDPFPTGGTMDAVLWMNGGATGSQHLSPRTYQQSVQLVIWGSDTLTFDAGTYAFSNGLSIAENSNGVNYTIDATAASTNVTVSGNLDFNGNSGATGLEVLSIGANTWTVSGNVDFNDAGGQAGTFTAGTGLLKMTGTTKTLNTGGNALYDFEVASGGSNDVTLSADTTASHNLTITSGNLTGPSSGTLSVGGSWNNAGGTFTHNNSTVTMTATSGSKTLAGTMSGSSQFYNLRFNGSGGGWSLNAAAAVANDLTMDAGTLSGTSNLTVNGNAVGSAGAIALTGGAFEQRVGASKNFGPTTASTNWSFANLTFSNSHASTGYTVTAQSCSTCGVTVTGTLTVGKQGTDTAATTLNAGDKTWTLSGTSTPLTLATSPAATFTASTSTVNYTGTSATALTAVTYNNLGVGTTADSSAVTYTLSSNATVSGTVVVGNGSSSAVDSLSISSSVLLTHSGATLTLTSQGKITGAGTYVYRSSTAFPTTGTIDSILRMDATNNDQTLGLRTYGGTVEIYNSKTTTTNPTRKVTLPAGTTTFSGNLSINAANDDDILLDGSNNPTVNLTGALDFTGTGNGTELLAAGSGTWTVSGNVDFTDGIYAPVISALTPIWDDVAYRNRDIDEFCFIVTSYACDGATNATMDYEYSDTSDCLNSTPGNEYIRRVGMEFNPTGISDTATILTTKLGIYVATAGGNPYVNRSSVDDLQASSCTSSNGTWSKISGSTYGTASWSTTGRKLYSLGTTGVSDVQSRLTGTSRLSIGLALSGLGGTGTINSAENASLPPTLYVGYFDGGSPTLVMNGLGRALTTDGNVLSNLTLSGSITLANATHTIAGNLDMTGGTITAGSSTVLMGGAGTTMTGGGATLTNLTIQPQSAGTITLSTTGLTVSGLLNVTSGNTLSLNGQTLVLSGSSGTTLTLAGTISGSGTLTYQNTATAFPSSGTISSILRMDASNGDQTIGGTNSATRTFGGVVQIYNNSSTTARTVTLENGTARTFAFASHLYLIANNTRNVTLTADTTTDPTVNITGDIDFTGTGSGTEGMTSGTGTWTVGGNVDFTGGTYTATSGNTLKMTGTANLISNNQTLSNLTIDGTNNTVSVVTNSVTVNGTLTIGGSGDNNNDTLSIGSSLFVTSGTSGVVTFVNSGTDTITGGTLTIKNSNLDTDGTLSSGVRFDPTDGNITMPARVYSGAVLIYSSSASARTVTMGAGTHTLSSTFYLDCGCDIGGGGLTLAGNTYNPTVNVTGGVGAADYSGLENHTINMGSGTWTVSGDFDLSLVTTLNHNSGKLVMAGTGTLTSNGKTLNNLDINSSGTVTLAAATHTVAGNLLLGGSGTPEVTGSTISMTGSGKTITGGNKTLNNLTLDGGGTTTLQSSNLTVSGTLNVTTSDTFSIDPGITLSHTGGTFTFPNTATISGSGTLLLTSASPGPGATGTLSSVVRFDATSGNIANTTFDARTYSGAVELYSNSASDRTVSTIGSGTYVFSSTLTTTRASSGGLTFDMNTTDPTALTVAGTLTIGAGTTLSSTSSGTFNVNGNYANSGTFTDNGGTVTLAGTSQQNLSGTMTGSSDFNNLTITNVSGSDPESSPSVIFSAAADAAGTFTATAANTKLRFNAGSTYAPTAINLAGTDGNLVTFRSSTPGTQYNFNAGAGSRTVSYTSFRDANACGSSGNSIDISSGNGNVDAANNSCLTINSISMSISNSSIGFGTCESSSARYATGDASGSASDSADAHTVTVAANGANGYVLTVTGATLTSGGNTITAIGGSATASTPGSEQFGMRAIKNSGTGTVSSPYNTADWAYAGASSASQIASHTSSAGSTVYGLRYLCNVSPITEPGSYSATLTFIMSAAF